VTVAAAKEGVRAGMTVAEARALCAALEVLPWDDAVVNAAITAVTALLVQASPQVSPVAGVPGMWWVGASGFAPGAASAGGESELALARALRSLALRWHPLARVAIAGTCVAARAATWSSRKRDADGRSLVCVIPPGRDSAYLRNAPLTLLPMDAEMRETLRALGIRTIGQFAALEAGEVEQRWGAEGLAAWRMANGHDPRRPVLARLGDHPAVELELSSPAATMEPVLFLVRPAVERIVEEALAGGRAIAALAVTLTLDDARGPLPSARPHTVAREIRMPRAVARAAPLFERCRGLLSRWTLTAPVSALRLEAIVTAPLAGEQGNLLDTSWRDPAAADAALERVRAELGPDVVVKPHARDAYVVERSGEWREDTPFSVAPSAAENGVSALRLLEKPERIDVDRDDEPRRIFWRGRAIAVAHAFGPERLSGDWWREGYNREYWRCESDEDPGELVLYRDPSGWWLQGWYD
jgi:protein ImuB